MDIITLLGLAALVCVVGVVFFTLLGVRYRDDDAAIVFVVAVIFCVGGAGWCVSEAIKRADKDGKRDVSVDGVPAQR